MRSFHVSFPFVLRDVFFCVVFLLACLSAWAEEGETITVIGVTPVDPGGFDVRDFPGRIQSADSEALEESGGLDVTNYLNRYFGGVHVNSAQGNPLQSDVYYRGFAASPLLGLPMGITVYQNGVRLNGPLGDSVNWELVPMDAVAGVALLGGANALYGLNTLGGALVLNMKDGFTYPEHSVETEGGSEHRFIGTFESGGNNGELAYYVNAQRFYEEGWRDLSRSWAENLYASLDWRGEKATLGLNYARGMSDLRGNGPVPAELLDRDRDAIFTAPDITANDAYLWTLKGDYAIDDRTRLSGNVYYRDNDTASFNGDELEDDEGSPGCGQLECNAINNISNRGQESVGGVFEVEFPLDRFGLESDFNMGVGYYEGRSSFSSRVQYARLNRDRSTLGPGSFSGGFSDAPVDNTDVKTRVERTYAYFGDVIYMDDWTVTLSGFFHDSEVRLRDRSGDQPQLNGTHDYDRFNWGAGAVYHWNPYLDVYGGYSGSSRLPTPIELACNEQISFVDEDGNEVPCRLPNAFLADPPLDEVVAESFEFGVRGETLNDWRWSLGLFHTDIKDDIIWQTAGRTHGLFKNVDKTRRLGFESSLAGSYKRLNWNMNYTYLKATFEDDFDVQVSESYPELLKDMGVIETSEIAAFKDEQGNDVEGIPGVFTCVAEMGEDDADCRTPVRKGDDIPGIPDHLFKAAVDYALTDTVSVGLDMIAISESHLRGDESNQLEEISGYAVFNARANYRSDWLEAFVLVENLFDKDYENFGLIGEEPDEVLGDACKGCTDPRFLSPGAPTAVWGGVKVRF